MRQELGALNESGKTLGVRYFYSGDPDVMSEHVAGVITLLSQSVWLRNTHSLARQWQTHLPDAKAELHNTRTLARHWQTHLLDATSLHPDAVPQHGTGGGGSYVEKPAETLRLASAS